MPFLAPVITAIAGVITAAGGALGITLAPTLSSSIVTPPNLDHDPNTPVPVETPTLKVRGLLVPLDTASSHLTLRRPDGSEDIRTDAAMTFLREGFEAQILPRLPGTPLYAATKRKQIGHVAHAWIENNAVYVEGEVIDTPRVRFHIAHEDCGLCLENTFLEPCELQPGVAPLMRPTRVFVCVPGQSAFKQSWTKFADPDMTYELPDMLGARLPFQWEW